MAVDRDNRNLFLAIAKDMLEATMTDIPWHIKGRDFWAFLFSRLRHAGHVSDLARMPPRAAQSAPGMSGAGWRTPQRSPIRLSEP
jgi:hypothetical protein